jgi:5-methyltetrahydrofolate--homocysteine methyltransferase
MFRETLQAGKVLLMDGAMGTELHRAGVTDGESFELWNLTHADKILAIHQAYVRAGAQCLLTNTFQANPIALARHGLANQLSAIWAAALTLARSAAGPDRFVIADIGPIVSLDSHTEFANQADVESLIPELTSADAVLLETCSDPASLQAVHWCRAALGTREIPVLLSLTYLKGPGGAPLTRSGHAPEWFAARAADGGVAALGVNCGRDIGIDHILEIVRRYLRATSLPIFVRPNAGTPVRANGHWLYSLTPAILASRLPGLLEAGITLIGGCCGTTAEHIAALRPIVEDWNRERK